MPCATRRRLVKGEKHQRGADMGYSDDLERTIWKLFRAALIIWGLLAATGYAIQPSQESELIALSNAWIDAEVRHDEPALERLLDERFLATLTSGKTVERTAFIDRIMSTEIKPFEVLNEVVNVHGNAGLVISTTTDDTTKFTWVAVKKEGQWRVISETFSKIMTPTPTATSTPTTTLKPRATPVQGPRSTSAPRRSTTRRTDLTLTRNPICSEHALVEALSLCGY